MSAAPSCSAAPLIEWLCPLRMSKSPDSAARRRAARRTALSDAKAAASSRASSRSPDSAREMRRQILAEAFEELNGQQCHRDVFGGQCDKAFGIVSGARRIAQLQCCFDQCAIDLYPLRSLGIFFQESLEIVNQSGAVIAGVVDRLLKLVIGGGRLLLHGLFGRGFRRG